MSAATPEIPVETFAAQRDSGVTIDVREYAEFASGHVPDAIAMPMGQVPSRLAELDRCRPVFVICASGNRSKATTDLLRHAGFDAVSVAGGTRAWVASGRPVGAGL